MPAERPRTATEWLSLIGAPIAALAAILTALTQVFDGVGKIVTDRVRLPSTVWWVLAAAFAIIAIVAVRSALAHRSRLLDPAALHLSPDRVEHLRGRDDDVDRLAELCAGQQQVNLVGESGAGKSALLRSGIVPRLATRRDLLPVYVDAWGHDWTEGPRRAVRDRVLHALSADEREAVEAAVTADLPQLFNRIRTLLARTPVLLFDQFDDYQVQHKSRFLSPQSRTWIGIDQLAAQNDFWRELRELVSRDAAHCLFATRADASPGLESVRLATPATYNLDRLEPVFVAPLLDALTRGDAVIAFPENGWNSLKLRLARDLGVTGAVLPAQMKLALKGLATLTYLTPAEYERQGGLRGLEAADVERHVAAVVRNCGITEREALAVLAQLIDRVTMKTRAQALDALIDAAAQTRDKPTVASAVRRALDEWQARELIRQRIDPDTAEPVWSLDHDYLCPGVLAAERRSDRWRALLRDGRAEFDAARGSLARRWRALLPVRTQLRLAIERVRGKLTYGAARGYAMASLARFAPIVVAIAVGFVTYTYWRSLRADADARVFVDAIGDRETFRSVWDADDATAVSVIRQAVRSPQISGSFRERRGELLHYILRGDLNRQRRVIEDVILPCVRDAQTPPSARAACVNLAQSLGATDPSIVAAAVDILTRYYPSSLRREPVPILLRLPWSRFVAGSEPTMRRRLAERVLEQDATSSEEIVKAACNEIGDERCLGALIQRDVSQATKTAELIRSLQIPPDSPAVQKARATLFNKLQTEDMGAQRVTWIRWLTALGADRLDDTTIAKLGDDLISSISHMMPAGPEQVEAVDALRFPASLRHLAGIVDGIHRGSYWSVENAAQIAIHLAQRLPAKDHPAAVAMLRQAIRDADSYEKEVYFARILVDVTSEPQTLDAWIDLVLLRPDHRLSSAGVPIRARTTSELSPEQRARLARIQCANFSNFEPPDLGHALILTECPAAAKTIAEQFEALMKPPGRYGRYDREAAAGKVIKAFKEHWIGPRDLQPLREQLPRLSGDAAIVVAFVLASTDGVAFSANDFIDDRFWTALDHRDFEEWNEANALLDRVDSQNLVDPMTRIAMAMANDPQRYFNERRFLDKPDGAGSFFLTVIRRIPADARERALATFVRNLHPDILTSNDMSRLLLRILGKPLPTRTVLEMLRQQRCDDACEHDAMRFLEQRSGQTFDTVWDAIAWAEQHRDS
jgi:hypothetical protein